MTSKERESYLRWFQHVQCRRTNTLVEKSDLIRVDRFKRGREKNNMGRNNEKGSVKQWGENKYDFG